MLSHCSGGIFPAIHAVDFHTFPNARLGFHHGSACTSLHWRMSYPQGTVHRRGDSGPLCGSLRTYRQAMRLFTLGLLRGVDMLTPTPWQDDLLCQFMSSRFCADLNDPIHYSFLGTWGWRVLIPPLMRMKCLNVPYF